MSAEILPFCPSCSVTSKGHDQQAIDACEPAAQGAESIRTLTRDIGLIKLVFDEWDDPTPLEISCIQDSTQEAANECAAKINNRLANLPQDEEVSPLLLDLSACAARIRDGSCELVKKVRDTP